MAATVAFAATAKLNLNDLDQAVGERLYLLASSAAGSAFKCRSWSLRTCVLNSRFGRERASVNAQLTLSNPAQHLEILSGLADLLPKLVRMDASASYDLLARAP